MQMLTGIRILDMSIITAGPSGTQLLGDLGADVIKVEEPGSGDYSRTLGFAKVRGVSTQFISQNRSKRSLTLNLRDPRGKEAFFRFLPTTDVVVENFRPGTVSKLGIDYESVRKVKPDIIYASISAFGQTGPYSLLPANDPVVQAIGGLMSMTGAQGGGPVRVGNPAPDFGTGMMMVCGVMAALLHRQRTGEGQKIELALLDTALFSLLPREGEYFVTDVPPPRMGTASPGFSPSQTFMTADGKPLYISAFQDGFWENLCMALDHPEWVKDPLFGDNVLRVRNRDLLAEKIQECTRLKTADEWLDRFHRHDVPAAPVLTVTEALNNPHVRQTGTLVEIQHPLAGAVKVVGHPAKFSAAPAKYHLPPPGLGEHTEALLREVDYGEEEIRQLKESKAI